jgi:hypothetical protein
MENQVRFEDSERIINTKSNLNFDVLEDIAAHLCLDISNLLPLKQHLNTLVHLRNNIAHGARPNTLDQTDFNNHAASVVALMEAFENSLVMALEERTFCENYINLIQNND